MKNYFLYIPYFVIFLLFTAESSFSQLANIRGIDPHLTATGDPGDVTLTVILDNNGDTTFFGGLNGLYVSLDTLLNPTEDSLIYTFSMPQVQAEDTANYVITIPFCEAVVMGALPSYVLNGNPFYVLYELDHDNLTPETNENDNVVVFKPSLIEGCVLGIQEVASNQFNVYPNPGRGIFTVAIPSSLSTDATVTIQNVNGQPEISFSDFNNASQKIFDLSFLPPGIYLLKIQSHDKYLQKKIILGK